MKYPFLKPQKWRHEMPLSKTTKLKWRHQKSDQWSQKWLHTGTFISRLRRILRLKRCLRISSTTKLNISRYYMNMKKIATWRSRSSQIAGSSTQQLLLCNNATFDDIILQHLMTSFCIRWHHFEWLAHFGFWIHRGKKSHFEVVHNFYRSSLDLDLDLH